MRVTRVSFNLFTVCEANQLIAGIRWDSQRRKGATNPLLDPSIWKIRAHLPWPQARNHLGCTSAWVFIICGNGCQPSSGRGNIDGAVQS